MNNKDIKLDLLRKIESNSKYTQRELSREIGVSLGKINYCMKELSKKGWIKLIKFNQNPNKIGYAYLLTPRGIEQKTRLSFKFLKLKIAEYEMLKSEISELERDTINLKLGDK
jgi:EPS-associated MarR family transcriptional regulator